MTDDKETRGFAALTPERRREIAAMGGRAVPKYKRTFRKNRELAKAAGRKGGLNTPPEKRSFSCDRALARSAGCIGGRGVSPKKRAFARSKRLAKRAGCLGRTRRASRGDPTRQVTSDQPVIRDAPLQSVGDNTRTKPPTGRER